MRFKTQTSEKVKDFILARKYRLQFSVDSALVQWETASRVTDVPTDQWAAGLRLRNGSARTADLQPAEASAETEGKCRWPRRGPF